MCVCLYVCGVHLFVCVCVRESVYCEYTDNIYSDICSEGFVSVKVALLSEGGLES